MGKEVTINDFYNQVARVSPDVASAIEAEATEMTKQEVIQDSLNTIYRPEEK